MNNGPTFAEQDDVADGLVSQVRGVCAFCADWNHYRDHPPCVHCYTDPARPRWSPSKTGRIALRLETDLAIAKAKLERVRAGHGETNEESD